MKCLGCPVGRTLTWKSALLDALISSMTFNPSSSYLSPSVYRHGIAAFACSCGEQKGVDPSGEQFRCYWTKLDDGGTHLVLLFSFCEQYGQLGSSNIPGTLYFSNTDITTGLLKLV